MNTNIPFIEKYRAKTFGDIKGQGLAINELSNFFRTFPKKKAVILNGPAGTGKTSLAIALIFTINNSFNISEELIFASNQENFVLSTSPLLLPSLKIFLPSPPKVWIGSLDSPAKS